MSQYQTWTYFPEYETGNEITRVTLTQLDGNVKWLRHAAGMDRLSDTPIPDYNAVFLNYVRRETRAVAELIGMSEQLAPIDEFVDGIILTAAQFNTLIANTQIVHEELVRRGRPSQPS